MEISPLQSLPLLELKKTLNDPKKNYIEKIETLLLGWKSIYTSLSKNSTEPCENLMKFLNKNTLQYLLHGDWTQLEDALRVKFTVVLHKLMALSKTDQEALRRYKLLIKLIHEPWKNSTLHKILHSLSPADSEVQEYISTEGSELLIMRLEVLCEGKCEDLAFKLASSILKHLNGRKDFKKQDLDYISDVLLMLLFKFKRNQEIIEKLKNLDLSDGLDLVKRFGSRKLNESVLWKFCDKVTELAAHTVLASVIVQNVESKEKQNLFYELVNEWALIHVPKLNTCLSALCNMVRKIVQKAESPIHVYIFAQVLHKQLGDQVKPLCIELYIRGFTSNINLIEHYKSSNDSENTLKAEKLLSSSFLELSELLEDNIIIHRECVLTSFSLHPTLECLKRLENAACLRCKNCRNEAVLLKPESDKLNIWNNCDNITCVHAREKTEDNFIEAVSSLNILNSDLLGLAPHLCDDLSTVLCSPRCQTLSWSLGWPRLKIQCKKYLDEHGERKTRNTELKYLNIDYSQFENETSEANSSKQKRIKKPKANKPAISNSNLFPERKIPFRNYSNTHKRVYTKNVLNNSVMKMNDILRRTYSMSPLTEDTSDIDCCKIFPSNKDESSVTFFSEPCSPKTYVRNTQDRSILNLRYTSYFESNEGSVLSCSNNSYENLSVQSPKPAEVPPVTLAESSIHERLVPLMNSVTTGNEKLFATDLLSKNAKRSVVFDSREKTDGGERFKRANILSKRPVRNDKLLAKYIPGMNSLDLIVPLRQEPTVQVVQIPSSNGILQPMSSNSSSAIQTNSAISIAKPLTESISTQSNEIVSTHSQTQPVQVVDKNHEVATNNSNLILTTVVNQGGLSRIHNSDQRNTPLLTSAVVSTRPQSKSSETSSSEITISDEPVNSLVNASSHEGSTQVTAHIQRVGQPHKQKLIFDETNSLKSNVSQNSTIHLPSTIQVFEEPSKHSQSTPVTGSVYRFILKDGKILEQFCQSNQNSTFPVPEILSDSNIQGISQQDNVIKLFKKKKESKKDDSCNTENVQVPSLPQFHQAFRRQVYQSGSIIENSSLATSPSATRQYTDENVDNQKHEHISSSPLSKGVQTVLKDAETSTKNTEKLNDDSLSVSSASSSAHDMKEDIQGNDVQSPSGVIFTCKVPITLSGSSVLQNKPVTILKPTSTQEMLVRSSQKTESETKTKDSVIRSNMNALLAAALQNSPVKTSIPETSASNATHCMKQVKVATQEIKTDSSLGTKLKMPSPTQKNVRRQTLVQPTNVTRFTRPPVHSSTVTTTNQNAPPVVTIPLPTARTVQVLASNVNQNSLSNLSKVDRREQLSQNSEPSSVLVSSTTLEQLREFESVLEQVTNTSQMKERGNAKKTDTHVPTTSSNSEFPNTNSKVNTLFQTSLVSAISDLTNENRVSLTFISKASTTCTNTIISGTSPKITAATPVVVVQSCNRPLTSPALSITSQNSPGSSPSTPPANSQPKINPKLAKPKAKSIGGKAAPTTTLKVSTLPKPQQKPQEDEQTTQRIYAILDKYAEQLRNSPELKNKPAPRRRSNPPTNPSQSSKRKKSSQNKSKSFTNLPSSSGMEMSPNSEDVRTGGSEDSSNGVSQVTQTVNSPHSRSEEHSNQGGDTSSDVGESTDKDQRLQHRILLTDQSGGSGRTVIVQDNVQPVISVEGTKVIAGKQLVVGGNATVPLTLQLPGTGNVKQVLFPVPTDGRPFVVAKVPKMYRFHQVTMPSGSPLIATNSSGTVLLRQMCLNKSTSTLKQVKLPVVSQISTHMASHPTVVLPSGSPSFTLSTGSSIDSESLGIALDNTILLNSSTTPASSIGFIQRNVPKSNQSPNILTQSRQMCTLETNTNAPGSEILSIKSENPLIKCEGETSRSSDPCELELKSEDIKYSLDSNNSLNETCHKATPLIASNVGSNWVQVLKDNAGNNVLTKVEDEEEKNLSRNDSLDKGIGAQEMVKEEDPTSSEQQNALSQSQGLKRKVENTIFQIAFKRDKVKISKDDFIQQRTNSAIERELRLQKSLSEECEDLGVDKPSTSDLFPEAELLLDPDPLSRDSLQGESFQRGDSSSSSSSPNHSPSFASKSSTSWKNHKRTVLRHKFSYGRSSSPIKKSLSDKTDSLRECSTFNVTPCSSNSVQFDVKDSSNNFKSISKDTESINDSELQESDITMECNDSDPCNFSDVDENNDTDILDTEGESDNEFLKKCGDCKHGCEIPVKKDLETDKPNESSLLRRLSANTFNKCDFYTSKELLEKKNADDSPWYQVMKVIQKDAVDTESDKSNLVCREDNESQNGVLEDFDDHQEGSNNYMRSKILQARKRKKLGLFMASPSEDSGSSMDTLLASPDMCSSDFHESLQKRASPRGRVKKGCPCFNGSPEPNKKKKDLPFLDKTEKPCSTKTSFSFSNKKSVSKSNVKLINRKR